MFVFKQRSLLRQLVFSVIVQTNNFESTVGSAIHPKTTPMSILQTMRCPHVMKSLFSLVSAIGEDGASQADCPAGAEEESPQKRLELAAPSFADYCNSCYPLADYAAVLHRNSVLQRAVSAVHRHCILFQKLQVVVFWGDGTLLELSYWDGVEEKAKADTKKFGHVGISIPRKCHPPPFHQIYVFPRDFVTRVRHCSKSVLPKGRTLLSGARSPDAFFPQHPPFWRKTSLATKFLKKNVFDICTRTFTENKLIELKKMQHQAGLSKKMLLKTETDKRTELLRLLCR